MSLGLQVAPREPLVFRVKGIPQPQGSMRGFNVGGRVLMTSDNSQLAGWRQQIWAFARDAWGHHPPAIGPIQLQLHFYLPRPRGHYGQLQSVLRPSAPDVMTKRPDLDKLIRAVGDALKSSGIYKDDSQINAIDARKDYVTDAAEMPGVQIVVLFE